MQATTVSKCNSLRLFSRLPKSYLMMMKLPSSVSAEKLENWVRLLHQNQELKPISRVETETSPISRESQSEYLW